MAKFDRFLQQPDERLIMPWLGGDCVFSPTRWYRIAGRRPREFGWYIWFIQGRRVYVERPGQPPSVLQGRRMVRGYLVGTALVPDDARVPDDLDEALGQALPLYLVEEGLPRFCRASAVEWFNDRFIFEQEDFPQGPEDAVQEAFEDRKTNVLDVPDVPPALDLAFRWEVRRREEAEELRRQLEEEHRREEARQRFMEQQRALVREAVKRAGTFEDRARVALQMADAELMDWRPSRGGDQEATVRYRLGGRRLECVCDMRTLQIIDPGVCLTNHDTGENTGRRFTLETLPVVIRWVDDQDRLVVWRHVD